MPNCTCYVWEKTRYPCKHFFAVFRKFPAWTWDDLSNAYINSPFINLDYEVIPLYKIENEVFEELLDDATEKDEPI